MKVRAKQNKPKTRRVVLKILQGMLFKQIEYEEDVSLRRIVWIKKKYIRQTVVLRLNDLGILLMNEDQLPLPLQRKPVHFLRVDRRSRNNLKYKRK